MVLKYFKKFQSRLVFAAFFWGLVLYSYEDFRSEAEETLATHELLRVHAEGIPYLNSYFQLGRCDKRFPLDILTKVVGFNHLKHNSLRQMNFKKVGSGSILSYGVFSYASKHKKYEKVVRSNGGFLSFNTSSDCFGAVQ